MSTSTGYSKPAILDWSESTKPAATQPTATTDQKPTTPKPVHPNKSKFTSLVVPHTESTFQVSANIGGHVMAVTFAFDGQGQIIRASGSRPYDVPGGFEEARWNCEFSGHREFGDIHMPGEAVATYEKSDEDWTYWRSKVVTAT